MPGGWSLVTTEKTAQTENNKRVSGTNPDNTGVEEGQLESLTKETEN